MLMQRSASVVRVWTPAKVNLFLEVLSRRPDGYHELATLMLAVSLYDTLEITEENSQGTALRCDEPPRPEGPHSFTLPTGPENLICRAVELVRRHSGRTHGVGIRLWKRIPMAAGLAGGSSDAAATLAGLNCLWRLGWNRSTLMRLGAELGSDVSFFFAAPAAWCTGRGEQIEPLRLGRALDLVLIAPPVGLSTAEVFRGVSVPDSPRSGAAIRQAAAEGNVSELGRQLHNRLQPAAERLCPAVADLLCRIKNPAYWAGPGPVGQLMTGSGSTVFALCRNPGEALRLARALNSARDELGGARVIIVRSCH